MTNYKARCVWTTTQMWGPYWKTSEVLLANLLVQKHPDKKGERLVDEELIGLGVARDGHRLGRHGAQDTRSRSGRAAAGTSANEVSLWGVVLQKSADEVRGRVAVPVIAVRHPQ